MVGGSLVGLTTALVLRDVGCEVDVYERSEHALQGRGVGIVLHAESLRYLLERTDLDVDQVSTSTGVHRYLDAAGATLTETDIVYRFTGYTTLHRALLEAFGRERYHLGHEVTGFEQDADQVTVAFADGTRTQVDLLIGADGIRSTVRAALLPQVRPEYAGYVAWRAVVDERELTPETYSSLADALTYFVRPFSHALVYAIPNHDGTTTPGGRLANIVWYRNVAMGRDFDDLLTDIDGQRRELSIPAGKVRPHLVAALQDAAQRELPPQMAEIVSRAEAPFVQALFDIDVPKMAFGRICLVGDAAFGVRPHAAAATAKGAADAWALADAVAHSGGDVPAALARWEPGQLAVGRALLERNRAMGRQSQVDNTWTPGDPALAFGLRVPGDSADPTRKRG